MKDLSFLLAVSAISAFAQMEVNQNIFGVVGAFPHYAVGDSWSTTIYMNVDGKGKNLNGTELSSCEYRMQFLDQFGNLRYTHSFTRGSQYAFMNNVVKLNVPDFNHGALAFGPVVVTTDCSESFPVKTGELVFTQNTGGRNVDGTVRFKRYDTEDAGIVDLGRFVYGFALFNPSQNAKAVFVTVYEESSKTEIVKNKLLLTLSGREQKIFVLTDLLPELVSKQGVHVISFSSSPYEGLYQSPYHLMLKFNDTGMFSSGVMY